MQPEVWLDRLTDAEQVDRRLLKTKTNQPTHLRALRNIRIHGLSSPQFSGCQDICTVRKTRSGCGIMIVNRPSAVVTAVKPFGEPFGLYG
jgi:hypothetical protein